jgi:hypothetical protein
MIEIGKVVPFMSSLCGFHLSFYNIDLDPEHRLLTRMDTCLASWQSDDLSTIYLIAQSIHSNASYCLVWNNLSLTR